jgi:hypothetical protein
MKKLGAGVASVMLVVSLVILAAPVGATPGSSETIVLKRSGDDLSEIGWWASGAFTDAGSWTSDFLAFSHGPIFAGTIKTTETNTDRTGTLRILFEIQGLPNTFQGNWKIVDGTGIYVGLHGEGKWSEADDPGNGDHVFTLKGFVH